MHLIGGPGLRRWTNAAAMLLAFLVLPGLESQAMGAGPVVGFAQPVFVDNNLAGGEPVMAADPVHGTLVYSSHEGTTHLYRNGLVAPLDFGSNYRNQVNVWTSTTGGATWQRDNLAGFQGAPPTKSQGFSDPDLTIDESARIYNTGIDLANDSLFSSVDGGRTFDKGTAQCHDGDRPWLAGGRPDEVFMGTDTVEGSGSGHQIFRSSDGGNTCELTGIPDNGTLPGGGSYTGFGKLYYDHQRGKLVEPVLFSDKNGNVDGVGIATASPGDAQFVPVKAADVPGGIFAHWPAIAIDAADNIYLVWDTNERSKTATGGCGTLPPPGPADGPAPLPNSVQMAVSTDFGRTFSGPVTLARPGDRRVFWPWIAAGDAGRVSVIWYEADRVVDPDCQSSTVSVRAAQVFNATDPAHAQTTVVDPIGRPIHSGTVCQGGTSCVATGQDRRIGDFFTNAIDPNGCVMIATGDTTRPDPLTGQPRPTALPLFVRQNAGPSLTGDDCAHPGTRGLAFGPGGVTASCRDRTPPTSRFGVRGPVGSRRHPLLRGLADDRGCTNAAARVTIAGRVARVRVSVARIVGGTGPLGQHFCENVRPNARFTGRRRCSQLLFLPARGTTRWSLGLARPLPLGSYVAWVQAIDARGNVERLSARRNLLRFEIRPAPHPTQGVLFTG